MMDEDEEPVAFNEAHHVGGLNAKFTDADAASLRATFAGPAGIFEAVENREVLLHVEQVLHEIARSLPGGPSLEGRTIIDVGAGTGVFETYFMKAVGPHGRIYACDISSGFVALMAERFSHIPNVMPIQSTTRSLCHDDVMSPSSADVVFVCDVYHHLEYPRTLMKHARRLLRPTGRLVVIDFHRDPTRMVSHPPSWALDHLRADKSVYIAEIESSGFRLVAETDVAGCLKENYMLLFEPVAQGCDASGPASSLVAPQDLPEDVAEDLQRSITEEGESFERSENGSFAARGRETSEVLQSFSETVEAEFAGMQEPLGGIGFTATEEAGPLPEAAAGTTSPEVTVIRKVPYVQQAEGRAVEDKNCLDIYLPIKSKSSDTDHPAPVYFHVHGGGWKRGDRAYGFYGAPSVCRHMAARGGYIAVAPSYRLGAFPYFLHDAAAALKWTLANISSYGGDPSNVVLSGHSAGGHIIALLMLDPTSYGLSYADIAVVRDVVLISGVYSLYSPLGHRPSNWKNWIFRKRYVAISFGENPDIIDKASPTVVAVALGGKLPAKPTATASKKGCFFSSCFSSQASVCGPRDASGLPPTATGTYPPCPAASAKPWSVLPFRVLVCNAALDGGLEEDGAVFAQLLQSLAAPDGPQGKKAVEYMVMPKTNHASICWDPESLGAILAFLQLRVAA